MTIHMWRKSYWKWWEVFLLYLILFLGEFFSQEFLLTPFLHQMDSLANNLGGSESKITSAAIKEDLLITDQDECATVDLIDILKPVLLKRLQPERISGVINLLYVLHGSGTEKELENALVSRCQKRNHKWFVTSIMICYILPLKHDCFRVICTVQQRVHRRQIRTFRRCVSFVFVFIQTNLNFVDQKFNCPPASLNCTGQSSMTISFVDQVLIDRIKSLDSKKLSPKVLTDLSAIADQFPYTVEIFHLLRMVVCKINANDNCHFTLTNILSFIRKNWRSNWINKIRQSTRVNWVQIKVHGSQSITPRNRLLLNWSILKSYYRHECQTNILRIFWIWFVQVIESMEAIHTKHS